MRMRAADGSLIPVGNLRAANHHEAADALIAEVVAEDLARRSQTEPASSYTRGFGLAFA